MKMFRLKVSWLATSYSPRLPAARDGGSVTYADFVSLTVAGLPRTFTVFPCKAKLS